jgi:tripeptide aminopeptidase
LPTLLFNAHLDTSPEAPGEDVTPSVIESYPGGDIPLARDQRVIRVEDCPDLEKLQGHTLVTTDGTTLLGGDDKAGVAAIMEMANHLMEHPQIPHGPVRILFTCDEEIGLGAKHMDLAKAASSAGYTLDGAGHGEVENENFSADQLTVKAIGYNIHPAIAKGRMINATRAIAALVAGLPIDSMSPESTEGKAGFIHPYVIEGGVGEAQCKILLRDFDTDKLDEYEQFITDVAHAVQPGFPGIVFDIQRSRQYRNMADALAKAPHVVDFAQQAFQELGRECRLGSIRGGTDGAAFSELGLPTPNLSVGQHNIHSVLEFVSLNEMTWAIEHAIKVLGLWEAYGRS